ncbi:CG7126, partial [Drosophila busckii]
EDLSTPSSVWLEYQRERFGLSQSNPLLLVKSTAQPPVDIEVVVTPKVETTSRRHSTHDATETVAAPQPENGEHAGDLQLPSMQGFLKFLKSMQSTWIKKGALSIENKIKLLTQLRDNLVKVIEQHFAVLWQPERHRHKRGILDESNLEFPPEAALMSINFLTFAVFLIKLVLVSLIFY